MAWFVGNAKHRRLECYYDGEVRHENAARSGVLIAEKEPA